MSLRAAPEVRDLPEPPRNLWRIVGPGIVAAGVGISSGEFILWPYIASQVGLVFLWAAVLGIVTQLFLNMEIERYTLATGETALTGFNRSWKHWGLVFAVLVYFANLWPGWVLSSATLATYLFGGNARVIAIGMLLVIGVSLTLAPVVYVALERLMFVKVALVFALIVLAVALRRRAARPGARCRRAHVRSARCRAAWIRAAAGRGGVCRRRRRAESLPEQLDPRQGIRHGKIRAAARQSRHRRRDAAARQSGRYTFEPTPRTWRAGGAGGGSRTSSRRSTFVLVSVSSPSSSRRCWRTRRSSVSRVCRTTSAFLKIEGEHLQTMVGALVRRAVLGDRRVLAVRSAMGITDYTSRLTADVLKSTYLRDRR